MKKTFLQTALAIIAATLLTGCISYIQPPSTAFTKYPQDVPRFDLKVGLSLTPELRQSQWKKTTMGTSTIIPIGTNLCFNAETLSRRLFSQVETFDDAAKLKSAHVDAILTPSLAYINRTTGATSFGDSVVVIKVQWTLTDAAGRTLWDETVSGEGKGSTGWTNPKNIVKASVEDLFKKSYETISSSAAIDRYAQTRRAGI